MWAVAQPGGVAGRGGIINPEILAFKNVLDLICTLGGWEMGNLILSNDFRISAIWFFQIALNTFEM